jgi:hypothetical protein
MRRTGALPQPARETDVSAGGVAREPGTRRAYGACVDAADQAGDVANWAQRQNGGSEGQGRTHDA